jgi:hypothetical protein
MSGTVAALFVESGGAYFDLPDVDPWDEARDARLYAGPWPVVAHPPCNRWSVLASFRRRRDGEDGGCFEAALRAVRTYGGVLEHPANTLAWQRFGLPHPPAYGWGTCLGDGGWSCRVDQGLYGLPMRKMTWLYACGVELPALRWGDGGKQSLSVQGNFGGGARQKNRSATPPLFREVLLSLARGAASSTSPEGSPAPVSKPFRGGPSGETPAG